jgi:hypothetical protein
MENGNIPSAHFSADMSHFRGAVWDAGQAIRKVVEQADRLKALLARPPDLGDLLCAAAKGDVDPKRVDQVRASVGVVGAALRLLADLQLEAMERAEVLIAASGQARAAAAKGSRND